MNDFEEMYKQEHREKNALKRDNQRLIKALEEIFEYSKHDGIYKYLDNCYVAARKALAREDNNERL